MHAEGIAVTLNKSVSAVRNRATVLKLGKMRLRKWTFEENAILTFHYSHSANLGEICALLPHRSRKAISAQATRLGLKRAEAVDVRRAQHSPAIFILCWGERLSRYYLTEPFIRLTGKL
jgi:hypothetical protein